MQGYMSFIKQFIHKISYEVSCPLNTEICIPIILNVTKLKYFTESAHDKASIYQHFWPEILERMKKIIQRKEKIRFQSKYMA